MPNFLWFLIKIHYSTVGIWNSAFLNSGNFTISEQFKMAIEQGKPCNGGHIMIVQNFLYGKSVLYIKISCSFMHKNPSISICFSMKIHNYLHTTAERLPLLIKQQLYVDRVPQKLPLKEIFPHNHCHSSQSHYSIFSKLSYVNSRYSNEQQVLLF